MTGVIVAADTMSPTDLVAYVQRLEALGYESVWIPDMFGREIYVTAGHLLSHTESIKVASGIAHVYGRDAIHERHRHRYEFNNTYRQQFIAHGMTFSGTSPDGGLVEIIELADHPWYVAVQYHPEFKSKPVKAHPLFAGFVGAAIERHKIRPRALSVKETATE